MGSVEKVDEERIKLSKQLSQFSTQGQSVFILKTDIKKFCGRGFPKNKNPTSCLLPLQPNFYLSIIF